MIAAATVAPKCRGCQSRDILVDRDGGDEVCRACGLVSGMPVLDERSAYVNAESSFESLYGSAESRANQRKILAKLSSKRSLIQVTGRGADELEEHARESMGGVFLSNTGSKSPADRMVVMPKAWNTALGGGLGEAQTNATSKRFRDAVSIIRGCGERLGLPSFVEGAAVERLERLETRKRLPRGWKGALLGAAALYQACLEAPGCSRTYNEIAGAASSLSFSSSAGGLCTKDDVGRAHKALRGEEELIRRHQEASKEAMIGRRGNPAAASSSKKLTALEPFRPAFRPYTPSPVSSNNRAAASWPTAVPSAPLPVVSSSGLGLPQPLPPPPPLPLVSSSSLVSSTQPVPSSSTCPLTAPGGRRVEDEEGGGGKWRCLSEHRLAQAGCESSPAASFPDRLNPSPSSSSSISSAGSTTSEDTSSQDVHVEHPTRFGGAACTHASENPPNGDEEGEDRMGGSPRPLKRQCTQEVGPDGGGGPLGSSCTKEREHMIMQQVKEEHESSTPPPVSSSLQQQQQVHQHQQQQVQQHEEEVLVDEERAGVERRRALAGGLAVLPEDLVPRFAASLALPRPLTALASAVAEKVGCSGVLDGKPPQLQAASALYLAHFLFPRCAAAASKGAVSKAAGVNAQALTKAHKACAAQWRKLLPADTVAKVGEKTLHRLLARSS